MTLVDELAAHRTLGGVPRAQLEWLASVGEERVIQPGDVLTPASGQVTRLFVLLDGHLTIRIDRGAGPRIVMEWRGGDVTGILPYSRVKSPPGVVVADVPTRILEVDGSHLPHMIRECHEMTAVLVHVMLDRARVFNASALLDEKMASLGRLAAGLAHELNNPASAVARSAKTLVGQLGALDQITRKYCGLNLTEQQRGAIEDLRDRGEAAGLLAPLERSDRQDAVEGWLDAHGLADLDAALVVECGFKPADLDRLLSLSGLDKVPVVLRYVTTGRAVRQLGAEIDMAASRIHSLVAAVKGFTYVNQQTTPQPVAIGRAIADTITVLKAKARSKSVEVEMQVPDNLPQIEAYGGELNQVWANLVDNAIDATPGGHVKIDACAADGKVVVRVTDDGPGIPADVASRIFDPFYTTKPIGEGTGLGLDIARRIVQRHRGAIDLNTGPNGTEFRVTLPISLS
jgi:signal transduction histidine kinase